MYCSRLRTVGNSEVLGRAWILLNVIIFSIVHNWTEVLGISCRCHIATFSLLCCLVLDGFIVVFFMFLRGLLIIELSFIVINQS